MSTPDADATLDSVQNGTLLSEELERECPDEKREINQFADLISELLDMKKNYEERISNLERAQVNYIIL